jgi:pimeloyl-ACP methyl ester carboxylesterase
MRLLTAFLAMALSVASALHAQDRWRDTTHHAAHQVRVAKGVRLHYLDFGGTGPALVFLAGLGNTAHAFDDFAPAFTDRFHVIAITRRGFGESDHPRDGYDTPRLVEDIRAVLDSLRLKQVSFVGHSIAGEEMTRFAATYPDRVDKLVYLDAAYDRVRASDLIDDDSVGAPLGERIPFPGRADTATAAAYVAFVHRTRGVNIPEADIRTRYKYDGWREEMGHAYQAMEVETPDYAHVRAPALAIYAVDDRSDQLFSLLRAEFKSQVANSTVIELHGAHHWIFVSHRDEVLKAARRFLLSP